jgi:hypothetical protein
MLIEELIRLGRPLLGGDMPAEEVLRLITDVADARIKTFYRNVFIVVLPESGNPLPAASLPGSGRFVAEPKSYPRRATAPHGRCPDPLARGSAPGRRKQLVFFHWLRVQLTAICHCGRSSYNQEPKPSHHEYWR